MSTISTAPTAPVTLARLTHVELRKAVDTRAGFWLMASVGLLTALVVVVVCLAGDDVTLGDVLNAGVQPAGILLPVVGILAVTSEWSQRTALATFTLSPVRSRVVVAKVLATSLLALAGWAVAIVVVLLGAFLLGADTALDDPGALLAQTLVYLVTGMLIGLGFGAVFGSSAVAIVLYFVLPTVWGALTGLISSLDGLGAWLDTGRTLSPLTDRTLSATDWAQAGVSLAVWMLLPLAIGAWRIAHREVK